MKKLLYLFLAITVACGGDDDSETNTPFLTQYNGVIWVETIDETTDYWIIFDQDGITDGKRYDDGFEEYCDSGFLPFESDTCPFNIIDNSRDLLIVQNQCDDFVATFTVTNNGNTMTITYSDQDGNGGVYERANSVPCE